MIQSVPQAVALLTLPGRSLTILFPSGVPRGRAFKYVWMDWPQDLSPPCLLGPPVRLDPHSSFPGAPWGQLVSRMAKLLVNSGQGQSSKNDSGDMMQIRLLDAFTNPFLLPHPRTYVIRAKYLPNLLMDFSLVIFSHSHVKQRFSFFG